MGRHRKHTPNGDAKCKTKASATVGLNNRKDKAVALVPEDTRNMPSTSASNNIASAFSPSSFYKGRGSSNRSVAPPDQNGLVDPVGTDGDKSTKSSVNKHNLRNRRDKNLKSPKRKGPLDSASAGKELEEELKELPDHCCTSSGKLLDTDDGKHISSDESQPKKPRRSLRCAEKKRETPGDVYGLKSETDICPICLRPMKGRVGTLTICDHVFCLPCITKWSKTKNSCPKDRIEFSEVLAHHKFGGPVYKRVPVEKQKPGDYPESESSFESAYSFPTSDMLATSELEDFEESDNDDEDYFYDESKSTYCDLCGRLDYAFRFSICRICDQYAHSRCYDVSREDLRKTRSGEYVCEICEESEEDNE